MGRSDDDHVAFQVAKAGTIRYMYVMHNIMPNNG
jgi:hypothetical protein